METNSPLNLGENPEVFSGKMRKFAPVIIGIVGFFLFGITFYGLGIFDKKEDNSDKKPSLLKVEKPKEKKLEDKKLDFKNDNKFRLPSETSSQNYTAISGQEPQDKIQSNENLAINDFEEVKRADWNQKIHSPKGRVNRKMQAQIELANRQNKRLMRDDTYMYRQTKAEEEEARREQADRLANERQQNLILDQLEKANELQNQNLNQKNISPENFEGSPKPKFKKKTTPGPILDKEGTVIAPLVSSNSTAQFWSKQTGFYNLNSKVSKQSYSENRGILAVVHGEAEGITVTNGQEIRIRLLEPLKIVGQNENIILPMGTLIPTIARIASDRLFLDIEGIFWENSLRTVNISVYDIDGREGLHVPTLLNTQNTSGLVNNLSNPISGGQFFMPIGSVTQQVGSSLAMNMAQNAIQAGSQYLRRKTKIQKVEIRSNYKIILFNSKSSKDEKTTVEDAFLED